MHGLAAGCLNAAQQRRLDGFQARCLRRILGVSPPYYSRISNKVVLERAQASPLSSKVLKRQLLYLGDLARRPAEDPVRKCVFESGTLKTRSCGPRSAGRPRSSWTDQVLSLAKDLAGSEERFAELMASTAIATLNWRATVRQASV